MFKRPGRCSHPYVPRTAICPLNRSTTTPRAADPPNSRALFLTPSLPNHAPHFTATPHRKSNPHRSSRTPRGLVQSSLSDLAPATPTTTGNSLLAGPARIDCLSLRAGAGAARSAAKRLPPGARNLPATGSLRCRLHHSGLHRSGQRRSDRHHTSWQGAARHRVDWRRPA